MLLSRLTCLILAMLCSLSWAHAASFEIRMQVHLNQDAIGLDIHAANQLALPTLWQRVVPFKDLKKTQNLHATTALILQFSPLQYGAKVVYNPSQVRAFLSRHDIQMIPYQPHWNLSIQTLGFDGISVNLADDLLQDITSSTPTMGVRLSPRGRKLHLMFTPGMDTYGKAAIHVRIQGAFTDAILSQTQITANDATYHDLAEQLQAWLHLILRDIRDAYSLGDINFTETMAETLLTIEGEHTLATQIMLEQALASQPAVIALTPTLLQKARRQYRIQLRDGDTSWIQAWFAEYGLMATQQPEDSFTDWLVQ